MHIRWNGASGSDILKLRVEGVSKIHHTIADNGIINEDNYWSSHWCIVVGISKCLSSTVDTVPPDTELAAGKGKC